MFDTEEWTTLIRRVMALTRQGQFDWSRNDVGKLISLVGDVEYAVGSIDSDQRPPYFFQVWDEVNDVLVARLESQPPPSAEDAWEQPELNGAQLIPELFELAVRSASGAPEVFKKLLGDLDRLDSPF